MALALNKTALKQQRDQLAMYQQFLPSLDLKRQQLIADYQRARQQRDATQQEIDERQSSSGELLALLGASEQDLTGLVRVESVATSEENVLGVRLPVLEDVQVHVAEYSMLANPFWVDLVVELLQSMAILRIRIDVDQERLRRLNESVRRITQRVNLFEKVLIPQAEENIQRIRIFLSDAERTAVVRSKIAKAKRQHADMNQRWV